jgi:hypothetical protein
MGILDIIDGLDQAQQAFVGTRFVAPLIPRTKVRVRIEGVVSELSVERARAGARNQAPGLAVFEATAPDRAKVVGEPTRRQQRDYLALFPRVRLILVEPWTPIGDERRARVGGTAWGASRAQGGSQPIEVQGVVPVSFVEAAGRFDSVIARFDGVRFIFEGRDRQRERSFADYLREHHEADGDADALDKKGLTKQEREAYVLAQWRVLRREQIAIELEEIKAEVARARRMQTAEGRLRVALEHAGAELSSFIEHADRYQVSWTIDGQRHTSAVAKDDDLGVMVAGICLSGQDARFDLASLVGVIRQGDGVLRVGDDGMHADEYFEIHPRDD